MMAEKFSEPELSALRSELLQSGLDSRDGAELLQHAVVWEALLDRMPLNAMVRNLGVMSKVGLLVSGSDAARMIVIYDLAQEHHALLRVANQQAGDEASQSRLLDEVAVDEIAQHGASRTSSGPCRRTTGRPAARSR